MQFLPSQKKRESKNDSDIRRYLEFALGPMLFAIDIANVKEILQPSLADPLPEAPIGMIGMTIIRDRRLTIIELHSRFELDAEEDDIDYSLVVIKVDQIAVGLVVDVVLKVRAVPPQQLIPFPQLAQAKWQNCVEMVYQIDENTVHVLSVKQLLSSQELEYLKKHMQA